MCFVQYPKCLNWTPKTRLCSFDWNKMLSHPQWILSLSHCHQQVEIWCRGGHTSHLSSLLLLFPFYLTYHMMFETAEVLHPCVIVVKAKMWRQANQIAASVHINSTLYFSKVPQSGWMMQNIQFILIPFGLKILRVLRLSISCLITVERKGLIL